MEETLVLIPTAAPSSCLFWHCWITDEKVPSEFVWSSLSGCEIPRAYTLQTSREDSGWPGGMWGKRIIDMWGLLMEKTPCGLKEDHCPPCHCHQRSETHFQQLWLLAMPCVQTTPSPHTHLPPPPVEIFRFSVDSSPPPLNSNIEHFGSLPLSTMQ